MNPLANRSIFVSGATGSFGNAFVRHALASGATKVVCFSRDELKQSEMRAALNDDRVRTVIGSVTESDVVLRAMRGVDLVVHAAALKQVPACEMNPAAALDTNALGSKIVASAAIEAGVSRAIMLSTDKASAPNTHYGATKLAAERTWVLSNVYAAGTRTRLSATRYGNILNSRGSVVPLFQEQAKTGRLTITDKRMTRYWMRLEDGVRLVELSLAESRGGEIFIPRAGSCDILTVAQAVAPGTPYVETGIRRGEKLHEQLISEDEARDTYDYGTHFRIEPERTWEYLPPPKAEKVPEGFSYTSLNNPHQLSVTDLRAMLGIPTLRVA